MKKLLLMTSLIAFTVHPRCRAEEETGEETEKDGKVHYALILPDEKAPELVKPNEQSPFGGLADDKNKETASGEETKVGDMLRSLPVVGKSSRNTVLLGDIILRRGELVPAIIPNQTVQLMVKDISPDKIELVWVEKKPTGLNPRLLTIMTDVSPQVLQRLPGGGKGSSSSSPVMAVMKSKAPPAATGATKTAQSASEETPAQAKGDTPPEPRPSGVGSSLLNMFFGKSQSQVSEPAKSGDVKPEKEEDDKPDHVAKP